MAVGNSDGDVVIDILLDGEKARKYWESFSQYMTLSTKQLEKNLKQSADRMNELEDAYDNVNKKLQDTRNQRGKLSYTPKQYDAELEKINELQNQIDELIKKRTEYLKSLPGDVTTRKWRFTDDGTKTVLTEKETEITKGYTDRINLLKQQKAEQEAVINRLDLEKNKYWEITQQVKGLQAERRNAYYDLKEEARNFADMNNTYATMKQNEKEVADKHKETQQATKDTAKNTKQIADHTKKIKSHTSGISSGFKSVISNIAKGVKKLMAWSLALIGIRSIYSGITSAIHSWLNSEDELAKKTKATIENLKANFVQILQPAIQWILNMFQNILAVVGAVVRQFTKLNIFAKKTATSTGTMSKNTQNTLASFDKIDVLQKNDASGGGDGAVEPIDMEGLMAKYEDLAKKIKEIFETIFDPVKKAWENKGEGVINSIKSSFESLKGLGEAVGGSIFEVWTNGTGQTTIETILDIFRNIFGIVGKIADAWKNAWNNDNNGTKIIQNVWDALNDVLGIIETITGVLEKVYQSEGYQKFANAIVKAGEVISQGIKLIADTFRDVVGEHGDEWGDKLSSIFGNLGKVIEVIAGAFEKLFGGQDFKDFYHDYIELLADAVDVLLDWWDVLSKLLVLIVDPNWENLKSLGESIGDFADDVNGTGFDLNEFMKKIPNWTMLLPRSRWRNSIR